MRISTSIRAWSKSKVVLVLNLLILVSAIAVLISIGSESGVFVLYGALCFTAASLPLLFRKSFYIFEPTIFILLSVFIGTTGRAFFLAFSDSGRVQSLTSNTSLYELTPYAIWSIIGLLFFSFGYLMTRRRFALEKLAIINRNQWSLKRLVLFSLLASTLSATMLYILINETGVQFDSLSNLSKKRYIEVGGSTSTLSHLRTLISVALVALLMQLIYIQQSVKRLKKKRIVILIFTILLTICICLAYAVLSSTRTFLLAIFVSLIVALGTQSKRIPIMRIVMLIAFSIIVITLLGSLRALKDDSTLQEQFKDDFTEQAINMTFGSGNFFPIARTSLIIQRVPSHLDFRYGKTYLNTFITPIPRVLWPNKPEISVGRMVQREIFGFNYLIGGMPAGFVGEAYINFSYIGIPLVGFLLGVLIKLWFNSFKPLLLDKNINAILIYSSSIWYVSFHLMELTFAMAITNIISACVLSIIGIFFVSRKRNAIYN